MKQNLLLLEDVDDLGRGGDLVVVKAGFARNYLIPKKKAVVANKHTLLMRQRLQEERSKKAAVDKKEASEQAKIIEQLTLSIEVKVDPEGKMYGSVSAADIVDLLNKEGIGIEKKDVVLKKPLKKIGISIIDLKLKEGVEAHCSLKIIPEAGKEIFIVEEEEKKEEIIEKVEEE